MDHNERYSNTCEVVNQNDHVVVADVISFKPKEILIVSIGRAVKIHLKWNGYVYESSDMKMHLTSSGPKVTVFHTKRIKK